MVEQLCASMTFPDRDQFFFGFGIYLSKNIRPATVYDDISFDTRKSDYDCIYFSFYDQFAAIQGISFSEIYVPCSASTGHTCLSVCRQVYFSCTDDTRSLRNTSSKGAVYVGVNLPIFYQPFRQDKLVSLESLNFWLKPYKIKQLISDLAKGYSALVLI